MALWVILILAVLIGSFAFDMHVEASVTAYSRRQFQAQYLARAGVEWARLMLAKSFEANPVTQAEWERDAENEGFYTAAINLARGAGVADYQRELHEGRFTLDIRPESSRRNVNRLSDEDWEELLDQGGVPQDRWPELIDCFNDWVDADDAHRLNGAESDDAYYKDRSYKVKDAPLDTIDELLLIKGFTARILYGGPPEKEEDKPMPGIAQWLTAGTTDDKVNLNTAAREVLLTIPGIDAKTVDAIIERRKGADEKEGTKDDGFESVDEAAALTGMDPALKPRFTTKGSSVVRVVSIGEAHGVRCGVWCIMRAEKGSITPLFWREEPLP